MGGVKVCAGTFFLIYILFQQFYCSFFIFNVSFFLKVARKKERKKGK